MTRSTERHVLQICHGYDGLLLESARQYAGVLVGRGYRVTTVFLTGAADARVAAHCESDEVLFMACSAEALAGLKRGAIGELRKIAAARTFAFCIAHQFEPVYVALLGTSLRVIGVHHANGAYQRRSRRLFVQLFRRRLGLLGVSDVVRDDIRRCLPGWASERIATLYTRMNTFTLQKQLLPAAEARQALGLAPDAWIVGNVGRLHPDKDQATLLRGFALALAKLSERALLVIIGSGEQEQHLKDLAVELGIAERVRLLGQVPQARLYFKAFDVFASSSTNEPSGRVLLEAMVAHVPLLAAACGAAPEIVEGAGILFPQGDAERLAQGLEHMATMDRYQRARYEMLMAERLDARFCERAVRRAFWQLPMVTTLTAQT